MDDSAYGGPKGVPCVFVLSAILLCHIVALGDDANAPKKGTTWVGIPITLSRTEGVRGNSYVISINTRDPEACDSVKKKVENSPPLKVEVLGGSGVTLSDTVKDNPCSVLTKISLAGDAPSETVQVVLGNPAPFAAADFVVEQAAPGPLPPGLNPTVDVMWGVVPDDVTEDNFGNWIRSKFYCIELVIGNNSGYPLQIASVGFRMNGTGDRPVPATGYHIARATLENAQQLNFRVVAGSILTGGGILITGFLPFIHKPNRHANWLNVANLVNGPSYDALRLVVPDFTLLELNRLDDGMLRDGMIVPNNTQVRTVVFVAKKTILNKVLSTAQLRPTIPDPNNPSTTSRNTECAANTRLGCVKKVRVEDVAAALGQLVLVGDQIAYQNRVRVEANPIAGAAAPTVTALKYSSGQKPEPPKKGPSKPVEIVITGEHLDKATIVPPKQLDISDVVPSPDGRQITAKVTIHEGVGPGSYPLTIKTPGGSALVDFEVAKPASPEAPAQ